MSATPCRVRISASSLRALADCSLAYYYARILRLPEKEWPRTIVGSLTHSVLECLRNPRHLKHYEAIVDPGKGVTYERSPAVARLVRAWQIKHSISSDLIADLNDMLHVAINHTDYLWTKADIDPVTKQPRVYGPEHEFSLVLDDGTEFKGFIDDMAVVDGVMVVRDYKTAKQKPTVAEVPNTIQAIVYQLYVWATFGLPARVEFVYLRHPPTPRTPQKHIQVVQPASPVHLEGLKAYAKAMSARVNAFTLDDALISPCDDMGFCQRVCTHYAPHPYWVVCKATDPEGLAPVSSHLSLDKAREVCDAEHMVLERHHAGCLAKWRA